MARPLCGLCVSDRLRADPDGRNDTFVIARSEATKQSRGHSTAVCGPLAPHVPPPLDCFVARAPRNDGAANVLSAERASFLGARLRETRRAACPAMNRPRPR